MTYIFGHPGQSLSSMVSVDCFEGAQCLVPQCFNSKFFQLWYVFSNFTGQFCMFRVCDVQVNGHHTSSPRFPSVVGPDQSLHVVILDRSTKPTFLRLPQVFQFHLLITSVT